MKKTKKFLALALSAAMVVTAFAGCGSDSGNTTTESTTAGTTEEGSTAESTTEGTTESTASNEPVTLRLWAHWGSEQRRPTIDKIIEQFNETYADQNISAEYVYVPYDDIETKMLASVTAGNPGNVVITAIESVNSKAMRNQAMNITEYLSDGIEDQFYDAYWDMVVWNDDVYAIPFNTDTRLVFYNKEMFEEAGVSVDDLTSWDAMIEACEKLDAAYANDENYMLAFYPTLGNFGFDTLLAANDGSVYDDRLNPEVPTANSQACVETLEHMKVYADMYGAELVQATIAANAGGAQDLFLGRKVAMFGNVCNYIATIAQYNAEAQVDYGVFAYPAGPSNTTGHTGASGGGFVCTVPYGASNPQESTLLAEFMATEGAVIWGEEQLDVMCCVEANENPAMAQYVGWDETLELMEYTVATRKNIYAPNATSYVNTAVDSICTNFTETDVQAVLDQAQEQMEADIEEEKFIFGVY